MAGTLRVKAAAPRSPSAACLPVAFGSLAEEAAGLSGDPGVWVVGELANRLRELAVCEVGEGDLLEDRAQVGPHRDPHLPQALCVPGIAGGLRRGVLDVRQRA